MYKIAKLLWITVSMSINVWAINMVQNAHVRSVVPANYRGVCPKNIQTNGIIKTVDQGRLRYVFIYSDGVRSPVLHKDVPWPGNISVNHTRKFRNSFNGSVKIKVLSPNRVQSRSKNLHVRCQNIQPPRVIVRSVRVEVLPINAAAACPKTIRFKGRIQTRRGGTIKYRFIRSDGSRSALKRLRVNRAGTYNVFDNLEIARNTRGWVQIKIIAPNVLTSQKAHFRAGCPAVHPPQPLVQRVKIKATTPNAIGRCPKSIQFKGTIKAHHAGIIKYRFERSDGTRTAEKVLRIPRAGTYHVTTKWKLRENTRGWMQLRITAPNRVLSAKAHFTLRCLPQMPVIPNDPMRISEFRLEANPELPQIYRGDCPKTIDLHGEFFASRAGIIRYRFIYSDRRVGETHTIRSDGPGFYSARESRRIGRTTRGWARMEILSPVRIRSEKASFDIRCIEQRAPAELKSYIDAPRQAYAGEDLRDQIKVLIRNHGDTRALGTRDGRGYQVDVILSSDRASVPEFATYSNTYHDNVLLKSGRISRTSTLSPGGSQTYLPNAVLPERIPAGNYYLCARVDPGNAVRESNERNNLSCTPLRILSRQQSEPEVFPEGTAGSTLREDANDQSRSAQNNDKDEVNDSFEIELLKRFRPYFKFSKEEQYLPSDALYQLQHATRRKGKVAESTPSFLHPEAISGCENPAELLTCNAQAMDLLHTLHTSPSALDLNNSLYRDTGSGKPNDWDNVISVSPGLYGHVVEDQTLFKIEYWQFFPYSESNSSGSAHEGDWETIQLWYYDITDKIVGVCHWAHGTGICFDMNKGKKVDTENGFSYYQGVDTNHTLETLTSKDLESTRYPASYQNQAITFYTKNGGMHPVVYIEKGNHAFWPTAKGAFEGGDSHNGKGHSYLTTFEEEQNLGELSATLPNPTHSNSLILRYNGYWGAEHQNLAQPPHGPTQRCQWNYSDNEFEMTKMLKKACEWE